MLGRSPFGSALGRGLSPPGIRPTAQRYRCVTGATLSRQKDNAVVVFGDQTDLRWLRFLKPGFRHCFVLLELDDGWVTVDSLAHWLHIAVIPPVPVSEVSEWYRNHGYCVVTTRHGQPARTPVPPSPFTCVEAVKRALGIHECAIWTPYQLWKRLNKNKNETYEKKP